MQDPSMMRGMIQSPPAYPSPSNPGGSPFPPHMYPGAPYGKQLMQQQQQPAHSDKRESCAAACYFTDLSVLSYIHVYMCSLLLVYC